MCGTCSDMSLDSIIASALVILRFVIVGNYVIIS